MTPDEALALPVAVPLVTAAKAFNMGRTKAYDLARQGKFPVRVIECGPKFVVPRSALLEALGISQGAPQSADPNPGA